MSTTCTHKTTYRVLKDVASKVSSFHVEEYSSNNLQRSITQSEPSHVRWGVQWTTYKCLYPIPQYESVYGSRVYSILNSSDRLPRPKVNTGNRQSVRVEKYIPGIPYSQLHPMPHGKSQSTPTERVQCLNPPQHSPPATVKARNSQPTS